MHSAVEPMETDEPSDDYEIIRKSTNRKRSRSRTTIRKLNELPRKDYRELTKHVESRQTFAWIWKCLKVTLLLVLASTLAIFTQRNFTNFYQELSRQYQVTFERLSRETNALCAKRPANFTPILQAIEATVIGQPHLPEELAAWFQQVEQSPFNCALFVGGTGVGKSLTASIIAKHYPYPSNVVHVTSSGKKRYAAFKAALFKIQRASQMHGRCAHYLLVMDHLRADDMRLVTKISDRLRTVSEQYQLKIQALFLFWAGDEPVQRGKDVTPLKTIIPEARLVEFKPLGSNELEECIRREASTMGIGLGNDGLLVQLVAKQVNATRHGCKPVRAKLNLFALENLQP